MASGRKPVKVGVATAMAWSSAGVCVDRLYRGPVSCRFRGGAAALDRSQRSTSAVEQDVRAWAEPGRRPILIGRERSGVRFARSETPPGARSRAESDRWSRSRAATGPGPRRRARRSARRTRTTSTGPAGTCPRGPRAAAPAAVRITSGSGSTRFTDAGAQPSRIASAQIAASIAPDAPERVAVERLRAAHRHASPPRSAERQRDRPRLGDVAERRRRRVGVDVVDLRRRRRRRREGDRRGPRRLAAVGPRLDHVVARRTSRRSPAPRRTARRRGARTTSSASSTSSAAPSPMTNPSRSRVERPAGVRRVVVVAGRQRPDDVERPERERAQRDLAAAGDRRVDLAVAQDRPSASPSATAPDAHEFAVERIGPRTSSAIPRLAGAAPPKTASARFGATWRMPFARGSARAAPRRRRSRRARSRGRSRSAPAPRRRPRPGRSPASSSASRPATSPNWLNRSSWRAVFGGIQASGSKSSTWAATWRAERRRVEPVDPLDRRAAGPQARPGTRRRPVPIGGDDADPGDPDATTGVAHVEGFVARGGRGLVGRERLGERLERRQRPAGDRPGEGAVDERAPSPGPAAGSRARSRPGSRRRVGSIRQVTSIPFVAPRDVDEPQPAASPARSTSATARRPAARARAPATSGRRATISATSAPSAARSTARDRDVVGEQPRPALDVAGEPEDELGRRGDVDARSCSSPRALGQLDAREREPAAEPGQLDEPERRQVVAWAPSSPSPSPSHT